MQKAAPQRFLVENIESLIESLNYLLNIDRDRLYAVLILPSGGIALESAELPDLPGTKVMVLADATRTLTTAPYQHWIGKSIKIDHVVVNDYVVRFEVVK